MAKKNSSKRATSAKRKATLALTAFIAVAVMSLTLTMVGAYSYVARTDSQQVASLMQPVSAVVQTVVQAPGLGILQGN